MTAARELTPEAPAALRLSVTPSPDVQTLPFSALRRSALNPRKRFDQAALIELAANIYQRTPRDEQGIILGTGIMQNLTARPHTEDGCAEIAAGERRYRAVELLVQGLTLSIQGGTDPNGRPVMVDVFCQLPDTYPMPVRIEALTDADLIEAATVENIQREDMTPLEEADAYMALSAAGRSVEYIALKYGKHPSTVKSRIDLASGLGKEGRKMLENEQITLEHAKVICTTTGALRRSLTEQARNGATVSTLKHLVKNGAFLVENALFDVEASGLRIEGGALLGNIPEKFADHKKALAAQVEALEAIKATEEASGTWEGGVVIVPVESEYAHLPSRDWIQNTQRPEGVPGLLALVYSTVTGKTAQYGNVARLSDVQAYRQKQREEAERAAQERRAAQGEATPATATGAASFTPSTPSVPGKVREAAHEIGHQTRAQALDGYLATHPYACLALACETLMQSSGYHSSYNLMGLKVTGRKPTPLTEESRALAQQLQERFPLMFKLDEQSGELKYSPNPLAGRISPFDELTAEGVTVDDLMAVFTYFTHRQVGEWESHVSRPRSALNTFAAKIGADEDVQRRFVLTAEYLNAYTTVDLHALIDAMPEACRPAGRHGVNKKELVALILEKAPALRAAGWLPDLVKFK